MPGTEVGVASEDTGVVRGKEAGVATTEEVRVDKEDVGEVKQ